MAWSQSATQPKQAQVQPPPMKPEDFFKPQAEMKVVKGLKVGHWGPAKTGKSFCSMTFPEPVHVVDTEFAAAKVAKLNFPTRDIRIFEATVIDPVTDKADPLGTLKRIEDAIISLKNVTTGTIVLDTITDYWGCMGALVEASATRRTESGTPYRFEWQVANERYKYFVLRLLSYPVNVVIVSQPKKVYTSKGEETAMTEPRWMMQTPHWLDVVLHFHCKTVEGKQRYFATFEESRLVRAYGEDIEDATYDKIMKHLRSKLKVDTEILTQQTIPTQPQPTQEQPK